MSGKAVRDESASKRKNTKAAKIKLWQNLSLFLMISSSLTSYLSRMLNYEQNSKVTVSHGIQMGICTFGKLGMPLYNIH